MVTAVVVVGGSNGGLEVGLVVVVVGCFQCSEGVGEVHIYL